MIKRLAFFALSLFFLALVPQTAFAKDYSITSADINININSDGSATFSETRTYNFDGSYSWADLKIPLAAKCTGCVSYKISNISLKDELRSYDQSTAETPNSYNYSIGSDFYIKWVYAALNTTKTFTLTYTIENAVTNHTDVSEFYWQVIGDKWDKGTENVSVTVNLPGIYESETLHAFGHGPLNGKVAIPDNKTATFSATNVPAKQFVEVRVLFPKMISAFNTQTSDMTLASILAEEEGFIISSRNKNRYMLLYPTVATLIPIGFLIYWLYRWKKIGDDDPLPEVNLSGSLHEPPGDLDPSLVEALVSTNMEPTKNSLVATVLSLAQKKFLTITNEKQAKSFGRIHTEYWLNLADDVDFENVKLSKREKLFLRFTFQTPHIKILSFSGLKEIVNKNPTSAKNFWTNWRKKAVDELLELGYLEYESHSASKNLSYLGAGVFAISLIGLNFLEVLNVNPFYAIPFIAWVMAGVFGKFFAPFMHKRTQFGNQEKAKWIAFQKFLRDYSVTKNYRIDSVILWEKYLVYGAALGISTKALSELPLQFPTHELESSNIYPIIYVNNTDTSQDLPFDSLFSGMQSFVVTSGKYGASGVGSSGGFSGGGGGGGGGAG
jgi:uncharacterized membrane protein